MNNAELTVLFTESYAKARSYAYVLARDKANAEDLVQKSYLKAAERIDQYEQGTNFGAWIRAIIKNTFLDIKRSYDDRNTSFLAEMETEESEKHVKVDYTDPILLEKISEYINSWGERDSTIIRMYVEGFNYSEIAEDVDLTVTNVGAILCRRRQELAEYFDNG
jgi:RNA polymerase sigma-70 factor, ECF subfamily